MAVFLCRFDENQNLIVTVKSVENHDQKFN